jgi:hypothetical protein
VTAGFEAFFRANYPPVVTALTIALGSPELAEDAAQHGFLQALRRWRRVARMGNPVGWVYVVAVRQARRSGGAHLEWSPTDEPNEGGSDAVIERMAIAEAFGRLTPSQRTVFVLRHVADLSAVVFGCGAVDGPGAGSPGQHQAAGGAPHDGGRRGVGCGLNCAIIYWARLSHRRPTRPRQCWVD